MLTTLQLQEATKHAGTKRLQIGQILVMYGYLTARDLQSALAAQSMIRDRTLDLNQALRSLKIAYKTGSRFEDVIGTQGASTNAKLPTGKLGELLLDAGIISADQFTTSMDQSLMTGLPLGRSLVLEQIITEELLTAALDTQVRLRDQMLTREEAIAILQVAAGIVPSDEKAPQKRPGLHKEGVRIGELFVMSNLLSPAEVLDCLERALITQKLIGEVLLEQGLIKPEHLDAGLTLQHMVRENTISVHQASQALQRVHAGGVSLEQVVNEITAQANTRQLDYQKLLTLARVIQPDDVAAAIKIGCKNPGFVARLLTMTGFMDELAMQSSLRCFEMLSEGTLNQDDAVVSLDYCLHYKRYSPVSFDEALKELGWQPSDETTPTRESDGQWYGDDDNGANGAHADAPPEVRPPHEEILAEHPVKRKFTDTLAPEDIRARELARLVNPDLKNDGILEKTAKGELGNVVIDSYTRLAESYIEAGNYPEAQLVYERILVLRLQELGPTHPNLVQDLRNLAAVLCTQEKYEQAEPFMRRAVQILEGMSNPLALADTQMFLANVYLRQSKFAEGEPLLIQAMEIRQRDLGPDHVETADAMFDLARVYRKTGRHDESEAMYTKAKDILAKHHEQQDQESFI